MNQTTGIKGSLRLEYILIQSQAEIISGESGAAPLGLVAETVQNQQSETFRSEKFSI